MKKITNYKLQIEDSRFKIAYARVSHNQPKLQISRFDNKQISKVADSLISRFVNKQIADYKFQIPNWAAKILKKIIPNGYLPMAIPLVPKKPMPNDYSNNHLTPNTLITFPQYLKLPIRFWTTNVGNEIRSNFNIELYEKVCEARELNSGVEMER